MASEREKPADLVQPAAALLALARQGIALKRVPRTGWVDRGVDSAAVESVADHSFGTALLAWACALARRAEGAALDPGRVLRLALIHDLAEATTGDTPPYDGAAIPDDDLPARHAYLDRRHVRSPEARAAKRAAEDAATARLLAALPGAIQSEFGALWDELRAGTSAEAQFVKEVDRLEAFLQSRAYLGANPGLPVESFRLEVLETIDDPLLAAIRDAALDLMDLNAELCKA